MPARTGRTRAHDLARPSPSALIRLICLCGALLLLLLLSQVPALAHARLVTTDPAAGQTITSAPEAIHLTYSEPIEESFSGVQVFDPAGERVDEGAPTIDGADTTVPIEPLVVPGTYTVLFRVIGSDGHPVESRYTFIYEPAATPLPAPDVASSTTDSAEDAATPSESPAPSSDEATPPPAPDQGRSETEDETHDETEDADTAVALVPSEDPSADVSPSPDEDATAGQQIDPADLQLQNAGPGSAAGLLIARILDYIALVGLAGGLVGAGLLYADHPARGRLRRALRRTVMVAGLGLAAAGLGIFVFGLSTAAAEPLPQALTGSVIGRFAATRFGALVLAQVALGLAAAVAASAMGRRPGLWVTTGIAVTAAALPGLWGHAGTTSPVPLAVVSDWTHVTAAATWVGGLAVLALHTLRQPVGDALRPTVRFSRLAGVLVWLVLASGVGTVLLHIGTLEQLTGTSYGRLVMAKTALFAGIAGLGWWNRSRLIPRLRPHASDPDGTDPAGALRRLAVGEIALMLAALGVAGGLASSIPAEAEAAARVEFVAAPLTDEASVNVTIDPARPGSNVMHLYVLGADGRPRDVDGAELTMTLDAQTIPVELFVAGPGHYTALSQQLPSPGSYLMEVAIDLDDAVRRATATVVVQ